jgi:hypothetical protein
LHSYTKPAGEEGDKSEVTRGVSFFFGFNIFLLLTGVIGFFGLTLTKNDYFGYCLHCTWFCGAFNLIVGLVITIFLFYGGVVI